MIQGLVPRPIGHDGATPGRADDVHVGGVCLELEPRPSASGADLHRAYLGHANLNEAILRGADLSGANVSGAYLTDADLRGASLNGASLSEAWLIGADLGGAYPEGANLAGGPGTRTRACVAWISPEGLGRCCVRFPRLLPSVWSLVLQPELSS